LGGGGVESSVLHAATKGRCGRTWATAGKLDLDVPATGLSHGVHHLKDRIAFACTQVVHVHLAFSIGLLVLQLNGGGDGE
jgi:hypothetical protein